MPGTGTLRSAEFSAERRLDATQLAVVRAWLAGGRFGLLLTGDAWLREQLWWWIRDQLDGVPQAVAGPGTEPAALHGGPRWPGEKSPPASLLTRAADGVLLVPVPELCEPPILATLSRAPRILASAAGLADVPPVLARRLVAVVHLEADKPGSEAVAVGAHDAGSASDETADLAGEIVGILAGYGLADHGMDLDAARLAACAAEFGADPVDAVRQCVCEPRQADVVVESAPPPPPDEEPATGDDESATGDDDRDTSDEAGAESASPEGAAEGEADTREPDRPEEPAPPAGGLPPPAQRWRPSRRRPARRYLEGRRGAVQQNPLRGRPRRVVAVDRTGGRVAVVPTIHAAAPWQVARQRDEADDGRLVIRPEDLRGQVRHRRGGRVVLIVVDASGSMARRSIRRAKAYALNVLDEAYRERALVGIVVVRGREASVGLPLTRSATRARASLRALPTGGGTPLASGLMLAASLAARYDPEQVETVIFTDGRANVGLGGDPRTDAERAASLLDAASSEVHVVDPVPKRRNAPNWLSSQFAR